MPTPTRAADPLEVKRERLFTRLNAFYADFTQWHELHDDTRFRCMRSGNCCKVGLEVHYLECENIARSLETRFEADPAARAKVVASLKDAFTDADWSPSNIIGSNHCAFYEQGCTVYGYRPAVCRMYGVVMDIDDTCPRERLATGEPLLFGSDEIDKLVSRFYRTVDAYGKLHPERDYTVFMPRGVLEFLIPADEVAQLKATTPAKFWRRYEGYRTQFKRSKLMGHEQARASRILLRLK